MDNFRSIVIPAAAGILGVVIGGAINYKVESQKLQYELIRFSAANTATDPIDQTVRNIKFWRKIGLINIDATDAQIEAAARCLRASAKDC